MSDRSRKISELTAATSAASSDLLVIVANTSGTAVNRKLTVSNLFGNVGVTTTFANNVAVSVDRLIMRNQITPANSTVLTLTRGTMWFDADYLYVATANNTLKRVALSSF